MLTFSTSQASKLLEVIHRTDPVCMMFTTRDTKGHTQMCLFFIFKVNHQGQVTDFGFSEILDIVNVRIDTN